MTGKLTILSAGAGAGKTTRLSTEIIETIKNGVPPENIVATTFTTKAADELVERIRIKLLESGDAHSAARILDGYVGTMNSVFGRFLREFALEMGLSPVQKVLTETDASDMFNTIASEVISKFYGDYRRVFARLNLDTKDNDWRDHVLDVLRLARENGMSSETVKECADYSWKMMKAWLPESKEDPELMDERLKSALITVRSVLPGGDKTKATKDAVDVIKSSLRDWERDGYLKWDVWAKLSKLKPAKKSMEAVEPIHAAASGHYLHPRLHEDLKKAIEAVFLCAAEAMKLYAEEKSKRGLIDFTDQESLALELLKDKENMEVLKDRISAVFVDEFQDSSPLQIALNMKIREIAEEAVWVGDVKQAIYGFRGTDPALMQTAMTSIPDLDVEVMASSWRSRKSLVEFVNAIFVPVFEARGMPAERVALNPKRDDRPEQGLAVEAWSYPQSKNQKKDAAHLALGVKKVLSQTEYYSVIDKTTYELRPLKAGDIAILCRTNDECVAVAEALANVGIAATVGESGLLSTPEVVYAVAALRYLLDPNDTLALAELVHFSSEKWKDGAWLADWLDPEKHAEIASVVPFIEKLDNAREKIAQMSPSEVLDLALVIANVDETVMRWGESEQRLANLDALRSLSVKYEEMAETNGMAATANGFLFFLEHVERDKELNSVAESTDDNAVRVLTYHKAKGLEWPFVILNSLERPALRTKPPVFDQVLAVSTTEFDVHDPLNGRRLYFWPWPYGKQSKDVALDAYVVNTPQYEDRVDQLIEENQRLMYVGMTRARDYLVFAARDFSKAKWLDELTDEEDRPVIANLGGADAADEGTPLDDRNGNIFVNGEPFPCKVRMLVLDEEEEPLADTADEEKIIYAGKRTEGAEFVPARFQPSAQAGTETEEEWSQGKTILTKEPAKMERIGSRLPLSGSPDMAVLGEMVHAFLAADDVKRSREERLAMAARIRQRYEIHGFSENSMLEASDRLAAFLRERYPDLIEQYREWPVHLRKGLQKASGWIDLLLLTEKGWVIVDHKTFPGKEADWLAHACNYLPQLQVYAEAISKATGKPVREAWIHMPVVGAMIRFDGSGPEPESQS